MTTRRYALVGALAAFVPWGAARAQARIERPVIVAGPGAYRLPVDLPLLAGASPLAMTMRYGGDWREGLGDLRLRERATGREVPYLFLWPVPPNERWQQGQVSDVTPGRDTSGFEIDLGAPMTVDRLEVPDLPERSLKRVQLEGSGDRVRWTRLVREGTLFNLAPDERGGGALRQTQLAFPAGEYRYLRLIWDDHAGGRPPTSTAARARLVPDAMPRVDTLRVPLTVERRSAARRVSRYHLALPATHLPIVALELDVGGEQVLRLARVTEPRLGTDRVAPLELGAATLRRTSSGDAVAANLRIPIGFPTGAELDLAIDDGDNPPLDLRGVTAVMSRLPSIFFIATSGSAIDATYGTDRRAPVPAPRYDLEAMRDSASHLAAPTATWLEPRAATAAAAATPAPVALHTAPGSPLPLSGFRYARPIPPGEGLTAIRLDAAVLAHSRLEDVRILDGEGRQVPYLLETLDEPTELTLPVPEATGPRADVDLRQLPNAARQSWYRLRLPLAGLPDAVLRLATPARVFQREIGVVTRSLARETPADVAPERTVVAAWAHDDPDAAAPPLEIALGSRLPADSLLLLVDDGDNQKLPLAAPTLLLPTYRLRFFRQPGASLTLAYGRGDLGAPRYDIALIAPHLLEAPATEVRVSAEAASPLEHGLAPRIVFWAVLGTAVVVLLVMIARLMKQAPLPNEG